jgi:hypothetical protein
LNDPVPPLPPYEALAGDIENVQLGETRLSTLVQDMGHRAASKAPRSAGIHARREVGRRVSRVTVRPTI